jgi:hypothetical protein
LAAIGVVHADELRRGWSRPERRACGDRHHGAAGQQRRAVPLHDLRHDIPRFAATAHWTAVPQGKHVTAAPTIAPRGCYVDAQCATRTIPQQVKQNLGQFPQDVL